MAVAPFPWNPGGFTNSPSGTIKTADPDIVAIKQEALPPVAMEQLILQKIGGTELIMHARHDTVDGQSVLYQPIKDVDFLASIYSPKLITGFSSTWLSLRQSYKIDIDGMLLEDDKSIAVNKNIIGNHSEIIVQLKNVQFDHVLEIATSDVEESIMIDRPVTLIKGGDAVGLYDGSIHGGNSLGYNVDMEANGGDAS